MKKRFFKVLAGMILSASCLVPLFGVGLGANASTCDSDYSYSYYDYYTVDHPGYYTTEEVVTWVKNSDNAVYDAYGNFLYWENVPDTKLVTYEDVWHPGWTENKCREVTVTYVKNPDNAVYDAYGNFLYYESVPDTEVVSYKEIY